MQTWLLLAAAPAACFNHTLQAVIEYLIEENRALKAQLGRRRLRLTDDQWCRLPVKGKIGRQRQKARTQAAG